MKKQLITNPAELKELYLEDLQEELFKLRIELAKKKKTLPWKMKDLEKALNSLKSGKCRDPEGLIREIFKEDVIGDNLKESLLTLYNKVKETGIIPSFMRIANICAI